MNSISAPSKPFLRHKIRAKGLEDQVEEKKKAKVFERYSSNIDKLYSTCSTKPKACRSKGDTDTYKTNATNSLKNLKKDCNKSLEEEKISPIEKIHNIKLDLVSDNLDESKNSDNSDGLDENVAPSFDCDSTKIGSCPISEKVKTKSEIKCLQYPEDEKIIYERVYSSLKQKYLDENEDKDENDKRNIWECVKRSKLERVSTSQDFILAINLKNQLISFKDTYYLQCFDKTSNDPNFKESLSELSNLFSMHIQTKSQSYSNLKTTVSLKVSEALNEFKNTGDERKTINKLIKRAPEVFLYINLALVFDHIESTGCNVSLYYSLLENLFNFIPREAKEKNEVIKDYREFLRRAMKFIRALNCYIKLFFLILD